MVGDEPPVIARRLLVEGRVQGVGYRAWAIRQMASTGLRGWVRNLPDRRVEAVVEGPSDAVEAFERRCHEGPPGASVERVRATMHPVERLGGVEIRG